jgi:hypothetical protein
VSRPKTVIRRLKYGDAGAFRASLRQVGTTDETIKQVVEAFVQNMERVLSLWELPVHLATLMSRWRSIQKRQQTAYGTITVALPPPAYRTAREKRAAEKQRTSDDEYVKFPCHIDYGHDQLNEILQVILGPVPETNSTKLVQGCEAILSAMLIGSWAAFETLAGDLWERTINARPRLASIALGAEPSAPDDEESRKTEQRLKYAIPVNLLRKYNYNLKTRMGTLLRGKWEFARRNEAQEAYEKVFGKGEKRRLDAIFKTDKLN